MALAVVGDRAHAVDIAEAVFVSAWKAASTLPAQGVELRAWLAALAHRELMSRIVQRAPEQP
jgi:DNA-directed RNA polymerase specialized sigma24 family protein